MRDQDRAPLSLCKGHSDRFRIIHLEGAFFFNGGRWPRSRPAGQAKIICEGSGPKVDGFDQVPFDDWDALKAAVTDANRR